MEIIDEIITETEGKVDNEKDLHTTDQKSI